MKQPIIKNTISTMKGLEIINITPWNTRLTKNANSIKGIDMNSSINVIHKAVRVNPKIVLMITSISLPGIRSLIR